MASGTLENLAHSAFVPTRLADAERICHNLLALPAAPYTVLDPTSGEGHLLVPFAANPRASQHTDNTSAIGTTLLGAEIAQAAGSTR